MLRYLSILTLLVTIECTTRQSEPPLAQSATADTSVAVMVENEPTDPYPEAAARIRPSRLKPDQEELLKRTLSLYQNLQELRRQVAFHARITNDRDTLLNLPQGTRLLIPANAFRTGHKNATVIDIHAQEYYSLVDIISENLTTTTEDNILETGGMIHIIATNNGEECVLNEGKEIQISFPVNVPKPGMQLFTGTRDSLNRIIWVPSPVDETELEGSEGIFSVVEQMPEFPGGYQALMKHINKNLKYPADARRLCIEGAVFVQFVVDRSGSVVNPSVVRGIHKSLDKAAIDAIPTIPKWKPGYIDGEAVNVRMIFPIRFSLGGSGLSMSTDARNPYAKEQLREFEKNMTDSTLKKPAIDEISYYILTTAKLGWINCDRFIGKNDRITFKVYIANALKDEIDVKLIFRKIRSVLPGNRVGNFFYFPGVPKNEEADILALHRSDSGLEMTSRRVITSSYHIDSLLSFQPVTVGELREHLKALEGN